MSGHGPLFDEFRGRATHDHDGSYYDRFAPASAPSQAHGKLYDDNFRETRTVDSHGERWDRFEWKAMPTLHGTRFDEGFNEPAALSGIHGSWFDAFKGGAAARFIYDGADYEGQVISCNDEYATVRTRNGQTVEVGFDQFLEYATPNWHQASPPVSTALSPGQAAPRQEVDLSSMEETFANKMRATDLDVAKIGLSGLTCGHCGSEQVHASAGGKGQSLHCQGCNHAYTNRNDVAKGAYQGAREWKPVVGDVYRGHTRPEFGAVHKSAAALYFEVATPALDVLKAMDSTETSVQGSPDQPYCENCKHVCRSVTKDGRCPTCGKPVGHGKAQQGADGNDAPAGGSGVAKVASDGSEVPGRAHRESDHHTAPGASHAGRCPHCGEALELNDYQTNQGQPSRRERTDAPDYDAMAHKCYRGSIAELRKVCA